MKKILHKSYFIIFYFFMINTTSALASSETANCENFNPLIFGILPFISAEQLVERFSPLTHYLSNYLQVPVRIETAPNFKEFTRRTNQDQRYDILFTAPHFYPKANKQAGYTLIAKVDSPGMHAVIVAPKNSDIYKIEDLMGKKLATVDSMGLASLLIRKHLSSHAINPDKDLTMITTPTHNASLLSSFHGMTDASSLMRPPFEAASQQVRNSMRIIAKTQNSPHIPISIGNRINKSCAAKISQLLLNMASTTEGKKVLKHNRFSGFKRADIDEYKSVKTILK